MDTNELHASGAFYAAHLKRCKICNAHSHRDELCTTCLVQEMRHKRDRKLLVLWLAITILLVSAICSFAQRGTGANPVATEPTPVSIFAMPQAAVAPFKQTYLTWDNESSAVSNRVSWGLSRNNWTNGSRFVTTNVFPVTNGWHYRVTSLIGTNESVPALWPSNRFDRIWVQTSTNLTQWTDAFIWSTNYNEPQSFLRLKAVILRWE